MAANVGDVDRTIRILAGLAILALFFVLEGAMRWWALIGFVPLLTAVVRWCPAYLPMGINTLKNAPADIAAVNRIARLLTVAFAATCSLLAFAQSSESLAASNTVNRFCASPGVPFQS